MDPNVADTDGATSLMHAVTAGHYDVAKVMVEYNRSGSVTIDMNAQDDNGCTAMDHADQASEDARTSKHLQQGTSSINSDKVRELLQSYNESVAAVEKSPKRKHFPNDGIELVDMAQLNNSKGKGKDNSLEISNNQQNVADEPVDLPKDRSSNIRRWAVDLKQQYEESGRMSALLSTSTGNTSRPASRLGIGKTSSSLDRASPSGTSRPQIKHSPRHLSVEQMCSSGDEDEDISLQSLSELVGTVRQYAAEIREIYAPIQKEEEERVKKRNEKKEQRKQKALMKQASVKSESNSVGSIQQEVTVEIHKPLHESRNPDRQRPQAPTHSRSHEPNAELPLASLHVENEQLSSTWPRGRQRPRSRDRYRHEMHVHATETGGNRNISIHGSNSSIASAPNPVTFTRPRLPSNWNEENNLQNERDILNKAFRTFMKTNDDPLLTTMNQTKNNAKLQEKLASSRQSIIEMGKSHQRSKKPEVPSISVIPPPGGDFGHMAMSPKGHGEPIHQEAIMPSGPLVSGYLSSRREAGKFRQGSRNSGTTKSSDKSGLRRRKSVDQGLGQNISLEKY